MAKKICISVVVFAGVFFAMFGVSKFMIKRSQAQGQDTYTIALASAAAISLADSSVTGEVEEDVTLTPSPEPVYPDYSQGDDGPEDIYGDGSLSQSDDAGEYEDDDTPNTSDSGANSRSSHVIALDAAHQMNADTSTEPIGPGASETRMKQVWGATGVSSGVPEYKYNLILAQKLKSELESRGYSVYMVREEEDVHLADSERAKLANDNAEIVLHLHVNADDRPGITGLMGFYPSKNNPYVAELSDSCKALSDSVLTGMTLETGTNSWGSVAWDTYTDLNYTTIPAAYIEVGYFSNAEEDKLLQTESYQQQLVTGIADGIDLYYGY